jgi:hypothetical protein
MKKCPPGVICVENFTMFFVIIVVIIILYVIYSSLFKQKIEINNNTHSTEKIVVKDSYREDPGFGFGSWFGIPNVPYNNLANDVLLDPYAAPLRDERYLIPQLNLVPPGRVPINISTNVGAVDTSYRQVGILTPLKGTSKDNVLPLMGRPVFSNRDMWQYYCISNQHNNVKLPIKVKGKNASNEYGVNKLFGGDVVYVEGANEPYKTTIYENDVIKYLPFI